MLRSFKVITAVALWATISAGSALATPVLYCKDGANLQTDGCISGIAKDYPDGGDGIYSNAGGGDPLAAVEAAILGATGVAANISLYGKSDDNPALFTLTGFPGTDGTWATVAGDMIRYITVKAANSFALYDVQNAVSGNWTTDGILNNGGQQPGVSHISFWTSADLPPVPLPAAGWMLVAGLGSLAAMRRRKKKS